MAALNSNEPLLTPTNLNDLIGSWGPLQRKIFICLVLIYAIGPFNYSALYYYGLNDEIWCKNANGTESVVQSSKCSMSEINSCDDWGFSSDRITVSKEWNLICEYYWLRSVLMTVNVFGYLFSGIIVGRLADKYGRGKALKLSVIAEMVTGMALIFTKNFYSFLFLRFIHGFAGCGRYSSTLILCMETVGLSIRGRVIVFFDWLWFFSLYMTLITCYFITDFRTIFTITAIYQFFSLIPLAILPESPRWQLVAGDRSKARKILEKYSTLDDETFNTKFNQLCTTLDEEKKRELRDKIDMWSIFKYKQTAKIFICLWTLWAFRSFLQDGLNYFTIDIPGSVFMNQAIFSSGGIIANTLMIFIIEKYERRNMLATVLVLSSTMVLMCLPFACTDSGRSIPMTVLLFLAHSFISTGLAISTAYTPEIFPTQIRSFGLGSCFAADKFAASTGSFINQVTASANLKISIIVLSLAGYIASSTLSLLPKTKGREIVETIGQMVDQTKDDNQLEEI